MWGKVNFIVQYSEKPPHISGHTDCLISALQYTVLGFTALQKTARIVGFLEKSIIFKKNTLKPTLRVKSGKSSVSTINIWLISEK